MARTCALHCSAWFRTKTGDCGDVYSLRMMTVQQRAEQLDTTKFFGVPIAGFENAGRRQLSLLLMCGVEPTSKVVDLGCGVLRGGYWLIHFLDSGCYHGIEPHRERLSSGVTTILEPETLEAKRPRFDVNAAFDTAVFETRFDFFLAYSIWTHASKAQIKIMLDNFVRDSTPGAMFLTSILPAGWRRPVYTGEKWFGTSHESDMAGCIYHSVKWIKDECRHRNLHLVVLGRERDGQTWLSIARDYNKNGVLFRTIWIESRWWRLLRWFRSRRQSA